MSPIWIITGKEVRDSLRNRWVLAATLLLAALALSLGFLGSSPTGSVKGSAHRDRGEPVEFVDFSDSADCHAARLRCRDRRNRSAAPWHCF